MGTQILGLLVVAAGFVLLFVSFSKGGRDEYLQYLLSAVVILGGFVLGALGRIESALRSQTERVYRRSFLSHILLWLPLAIIAALAAAWYLWESPVKPVPDKNIPKLEQKLDAKPAQ
jgi:hypothetical protein